MGVRILIVDDSKLSRKMLRKTLEAGGHTVIEAQDGLQALEVYSLQPPDLVLLDMVMEGMHGIEVLQKLKELDPNARVVLATADVQLQTASSAKQAGALGLVKKPFQDNVILSAVENALSGGTHWS